MPYTSSAPGLDDYEIYVLTKAQLELLKLL
jgi:hypothetical protein